MKKQIIEALRTRYASLGLGDETLDKIAAAVEPGIKEEKDIETAVAGLEPVLKVMQSSADAYRNEKAGLVKQLEDYRKAHPAPTEEEKKDDDEEAGKDEPLTAASVKAIIAEALKPVNDRFSEQDAREKAAERRTQIAAKAAQYGIPEAVSQYMQVPDDADLDSFMKRAKQVFADNGFSGVKPPQTAEQQQKTDSEAIAKMISDGTKSIVESQKK